MTLPGRIAPSSRPIRQYYEALQAFRDQRVDNEMSVRAAFQSLLADTARSKGWTLIPELSDRAAGARLVIPDGTLRDSNSLPRGYWEAKDTKDDLDDEVRRKLSRGYGRFDNIIFEDTERAVLRQKGREPASFAIGDPKELAELLNQFYGYVEPDIERFDKAVDEFKERVPELARGLAEKIKEAHRDNASFQQAFEAFFKLCQTALNPNIRVEAVDEMLVQHLLTERLIRTIFDNPEFTKRNAIAVEVEHVIDVLVSRSFNRSDYLKSLDPFYRAIESAARTLPDFSDKQHFLNTVYERFFQGYSVKVADTHGIVYTPQPIVDFMCASVAEVLEKEFGKSLSSPGVCIIDPCTGTGNFIVNLLRRIPKRDLPRMYRDQLFANEVMLLPYYIAALNIEHAYYELTRSYEPFEGLCFVDTLDLTEKTQRHLYVTEKNAERVERQRRALITVVIGNPPYNMNQQNENDNNKNRKYKDTGKRVADTYSKNSTASNKGALSDPYVKFFRWATDRLGERDGIVAFVSNNSFSDQQAFDGMRKHLMKDFTNIYHVDLHGNVRRNPKLSGTTHNVFGIRVGVGVTVAVRKKGAENPTLSYYRVQEDWRREQKLAWLGSRKSIGGVDWETPVVSAGASWVPSGAADDFRDFLALGTEESRRRRSPFSAAIFRTFSRGIETARDEWTYALNSDDLAERVPRLIETYDSELDRWRRAKEPDNVDDFVTYDPSKIKWSSRLKEAFRRDVYLVFDKKKIRPALYRPFTKKHVYFDSSLTHRRGMFAKAIPEVGSRNMVICCTDHLQIPFSAQVTDITPDFAIGGRAGQCFPFCTYDETGATVRENITNWALEHFRKQYGDDNINKWTSSTTFTAFCITRSTGRATRRI